MNKTLILGAGAASLIGTLALNYIGSGRECKDVSTFSAEIQKEISINASKIDKIRGNSQNKSVKNVCIIKRAYFDKGEIVYVYADGTETSLKKAIYHVLNENKN